MSTPPKPSSPSPASANKMLHQLKKLLTSPYGVAAMASLSFHGVMFAAAPRFSSASFAAFSDENLSGETRTVPLVTLSPAEQGRLPNFTRPSLPPIPNSAATTSLRTLPSASTLTRPSSPLTRSNIFDRYTNRTNSSRGSRRFNNPYNLPTTNPPSRSARSSDRRTTIVGDIPAPPRDIGRNLESDPDTLETELELERQAEAQAEAEALAGLPELPAQSEDVPGTEGSETEGLEAEGSEAEGLDPENSEVAINAEESREPTQLERLQAKFKHDPEGASEEEATLNYTAWLTASEDDSETSDETSGENTDETPSEIPMADVGAVEVEALNLCVATPPNNGLVGLLVAPDGTPSESVVLRSTGYEYLNQAALDALLEEGDFPETETAVRYPFEVLVSYDAETCQSSEAIIDTAQDAPSAPEE
ncbi:MAG: energy transducer TonB [Cyanobacteria bacterium P01_A01_bin.137]